jgi:transcriptional regulator with XRE-family HTH domain
MTSKQLKAIRAHMGLTQAAFAARIGMAGNSVARMERGEMIITPPMALLIGYVAREAGVDFTDRPTGSRPAPAKRAQRSKARNTVRQSRRRQGSEALPARGR